LFGHAANYNQINDVPSAITTIRADKRLKVSTIGDALAQFEPPILLQLRVLRFSRFQEDTKQPAVAG
jgi:hypothetical protein